MLFIRGKIHQINDYYPSGLNWSRPEGDDARMYQNKQWQQNEWGTDRLPILAIFDL